MGYRRNRRLDLEFPADDPQWEGLEVTALRPALGDYFAMRSLTPDPEGTERAIALFAPYLDAWNLEDDDGEPIPATAETFRQQDPELVIAILDAWVDAVDKASRPPAPLAEPSNGGEPLEEASIPMDVSLPSRAS